MVVCKMPDELKAIIQLEDKNSVESNNPCKSVIQTMSYEIVLYQSNELPERIEVRVEKDTVWLNPQQLSLLFGRDVKTLGIHINNVFAEGELPKR